MKLRLCRESRGGRAAELTLQTQYRAPSSKTGVFFQQIDKRRIFGG
jgi:hypothetical protein